MASLNNCQFIGNLARDPETRYLPNGDAVTSISIGVTDKWTDKATGEKKELTEWVRVSFFGKLAEIAGQYLKKGALVYVEGSMRTRKYVDKDGVEKYATDIRGNQMQMLGSRPAGNDDQQQYQQPQQQQQRPTGNNQQQQRPQQQRPQQPQQQSRPAPEWEDDIPF